jgi:hypothetical protein
MQYCSLNDPDPLGDVEAAGGLSLTWPQIVVAHLSFHAARVDPIPTGHDTLLKDFIEDRFIQDFPVLRGE